MEQLQITPGVPAPGYFSPPTPGSVPAYGQANYPQNGYPSGPVPGSPVGGVAMPTSTQPGVGAAPRAGGVPTTHAPYQPPNTSHSLRKLDPRTLPNPSKIPFTPNRVNYNTSTFGNPPAAWSKYFVDDRGSCSPRFMRSTLSQIPNSSSLLNQTRIPMAVVVQPLADVGIEEEEVPILDGGASGPIRCRRCSAYISPFARFVENGRCYICPMCSTQNEVPDEYFSPIEGNGLRRDIAERQELWRGSVDWIAPADFITRTEAEPPLILFVIDVSATSLQSGLLRGFVNSAKQIMEAQFAEDSNVQFGFITFNKSIHFWRLVPKLQLVMVPHVDHVFSPLPASCLIANYATQRQLIDAFFNEVILTFPQQQTQSAAESCLGSAINAAMLAIGNKRGGRIVLLQSSLPNQGPFALKSREDVSSYGKDAERNFYQPFGKQYASLAGECAKRFIQIDTLACGSGYCDLATLGDLSRLTGGHFAYMPGFALETHEEKLYYDLFRIMTRAHGSEAIGRLRTSEGLVVDSYSGHFMPGEGDVELAGIDADQTLVVYLKHDGSIDEKKNAVIQFAMVHTNEAGQRLIRVHTLAMHATNVIANVFKSADMSAVFLALIRSTLSTLGKDTISEIRTEITNRTAAILASYRKYCTKSGRNDQELILPEALKLLPVHILGVLKSILLSNPTSVADIPSIADMRMAYVRLMFSASLESLIPHFYPRIYSVHKLHRRLEVERLRRLTKESDAASDEEEDDDNSFYGIPLPGDEDHYGSYWLPGLIRASAAELEAGGVYLMDTGEAIVLAFHPPIDTNISSVLLNEQGQLIYNEESDLNTRVWKMIEAIRYRRPSYQPVLLTDTSQNTPARRLFYSRFIEDGSDDYQNKDQIKLLYKLGYYGYLCHVHLAVQDKI
jgi:protein transport protein SEC24